MAAGAELVKNSTISGTVMESLIQTNPVAGSTRYGLRQATVPVETGREAESDDVVMTAVEDVAAVADADGDGSVLEGAPGVGEEELEEEAGEVETAVGEVDGSTARGDFESEASGLISIAGWGAWGNASAGSRSGDVEGTT